MGEHELDERRHIPEKAIQERESEVDEYESLTQSCHATLNQSAVTVPQLNLSFAENKVMNVSQASYMKPTKSSVVKNAQVPDATSDAEILAQFHSNMRGKNFNAQKLKIK